MTQQVQEPHEINRDALKVQSLLQRISQHTQRYEEEIANYRADATIIIEGQQLRIQNLEARNAELEAGQQQGVPDDVGAEETPSDD